MDNSGEISTSGGSKKNAPRNEDDEEVYEKEIAEVGSYYFYVDTNGATSGTVNYSTTVVGTGAGSISYDHEATSPVDYTESAVCLTSNLYKDGYKFAGWQVQNNGFVWGYGLSSSDYVSFDDTFLDSFRCLFEDEEFYYGDTGTIYFADLYCNFEYLTSDSLSYGLGEEVYFGCYANDLSEFLNEPFFTYYDPSVDIDYIEEWVYAALVAFFVEEQGYDEMAIYAEWFEPLYEKMLENLSSVSKLGEVNLTFTALWEEAETYSLTYNSNFTSINSNLSDEESSQVVYEQNTFETLADSAFSCNGYTLIGWSTTPIEPVTEDDLSWSESGTYFTGESGTFWACGTNYLYNLSSDATLYAVWKKDFLTYENGYWYFEDGHMPQSYCESTPSDVDTSAASEAYAIRLSTSSWAQVEIFAGTDDDYAYVTIYSGENVEVASAWFVVEPIVWVVAYGSDTPTSVTSAVTAQIVTAGYVYSNAGTSFSWATDSVLGLSIENLTNRLGLTYASVGDFAYDSFSGTLSQIAVTDNATTLSSKIAVSSVEEIDALGGSYASTCTDFVAYLLSGGASTDGDSYSADYWTRDLAAELDEDSTYYSNTNTTFTYDGALNNGVYVTKDGTLSNAKLSTLMGARLTMNI